MSQRSSPLRQTPAPASTTAAGAIRQLFATVQKALTSPAPQRSAPKKSSRKGGDEKNSSGMLRPWRNVAQRVTINFRRMAREAFTQGKALSRYRPFVRQAPVTTVDGHFWFQQWQTGAAPIADNAADFQSASAAPVALLDRMHG